VGSPVIATWRVTVTVTVAGGRVGDAVVLPAAAVGAGVAALVGAGVAALVGVGVGARVGGIPLVAVEVSVGLPVVEEEEEEEEEAGEAPVVPPEVKVLPSTPVVLLTNPVEDVRDPVVVAVLFLSCARVVRKDETSIKQTRTRVHSCNVDTMID
jgi:hypothetical protein